MEEKKLFLLDGMALVFRAFFAFSQNPRITSYGLNTSAIYGFANTLLDVLKNQNPSHIAVAFDTPEQTNRAKEHEFYKANRDEMPEDIAKALPYVFELLDGMNIPTILLPGWEADDVIGTLAKKAEQQGFTTYMMTPDKDFAQLVSEKIFIYKPARMGKGAEIMGIPEVLAKWEVEKVEQVIDILGLWGDSVDNIPGVPGVGEKTAKKFIALYGSIENTIEHIHEMKGKMKEKFEANIEQALISKKLATIDIDSPIDFEPERYLVEDWNEPFLTELFKKLEFRTLGKRMFNKTIEPVQQDLFGNVVGAAPSADSNSSQASADPIAFDVDSAKYQLVESEADIQQWIKKAESAKAFCFDTETTGLDPMKARVIGVALSIKAGEACYIPIPNNDEGTKRLKLLERLFQSTSLKIAQNLKYDWHILRNAGINLKPPFYDTMLAHYLIEPDQRHGMDRLAQKYLNYTPISIETLIGKKGKNQLSMEDVEMDKLVNYAAEDADITLRLKEILEPLVKEQNAQSVLEELELPLIPVLLDMEREGIRVNTQFLNDYSKELTKDIAAHEKAIYEMAGVEFNIASPKQLGEVLFDRLQLDDKAKKTKTGQYKTGEDILIKLADRSEIVRHILDFRQLQKLKSTYVDALPQMVNTDTGKIHTTFNQTVAATGRLSSMNPNLQNIPIRTEKGRLVRKAFIPSEGNVLVSADYSQVELRVVASISGDEGMIDAFNQGLDIHSATAAKVFGVGLEEVTKEQRYKAKSVNFGLIYGQGAFGLSQNLGISRTEAKEIIENYFTQFPKIKQYMDVVIEGAKSKGYVETLLGRRRYIRDINSGNATVRGFAERNAINAPIQGTAADMIKIAMIEIHEALKGSNLQSKMILQVHDELIFDVPVNEKEELKALVIENMSNAMPLKVPLLVEAGEGKNWLEAH